MPIDMSMAKAPPAREPGAIRGGRPPSKARANVRKEAVDGIFQMLGFACISTGNLADAGAINKYGEPVAKEVADLGEKYPESVGKYLDYLTQVGPFAGLITAALPLVAQILVNHKRMRPEAGAMLGCVKPEALEAGVKAELARSAMLALREQQEAEAELSRMSSEMGSMANGGEPGK